jgi:hypothetical protein
MAFEDRLHRFLLNCSVIERDARQLRADYGIATAGRNDAVDDEKVGVFVRQFDLELRKFASEMSRYYEIFFMLENQIRDLIAETLEAAHGPNWWDHCVPSAVKEEVKKNREREEKEAMSVRSEFDIDYTTFGQLSDIIRTNWSDFAGMLSNEPAMTRVLGALNRLRGPIAHCGLLAEDEVDRLKLAIKDWFRVLAGPRKR